MRWVYKIYYIILWPIFKVFFRYKGINTDRIPEGAALFCANHSGYSDPILVDLCCGFNSMIHFMAKKDLFSKPILGAFIRWGGTIPIDRDNADIEGIRTAMRYLKNGEKVGIFPEGTRAKDGDIEAKAGAIRIAAKTGAPIVPVYIPRNKKFLHKTVINFGVPYTVSVDRKAVTPNTYNDLARELMEKIEELRTDK